MKKKDNAHPFFFMDFSEYDAMQHGRSTDIVEHKTAMANIHAWRDCHRVSMHVMYAWLAKSNVSHDVLKLFRDRMDQIDLMERHFQLRVKRRYHVQYLRNITTATVAEMNAHLPPP